MASRAAVLAGMGIALGVALAGCGGGGGSSAASTASTTGQSAPTTTTVNMVVTDTPSTALTVLAFQVQITAAVLQPGNVSLLPRPVTVDLAQLVSDTAFLSSTVIDSATYTSLELTFADPQVTLLNNTGATLTASGQSCAAGATCTFVPALNTATLTISTGVFPVTLTANSSTGLQLDLSIPDLLQSDLSIAFANGQSVNLSLLPGQTLASQQASIDDVIGSVTAVSGTQINITTAFGDQLVLTSDASTTYSYPSTVCSTGNAACVATGQIVTGDLRLLGDGSLGINALSYLAAAGTPLVKGLVLSSDTSTATPTAQVLVQRTLNVSAFGPGQVATVSLPAGAVFAVGTPAYPAASGMSFAGASDLMPGQELVLDVGSDLAATSFSAASATLEVSQVIGAVTSVDAGTSSLSLDGLSGLFTGARPVVQLLDVQTGTATTFNGFATPALTAVSAGQFVVAKGPLFSGTSGTPDLAATQLATRPAGN